MYIYAFYILYDIHIVYTYNYHMYMYIHITIIILFVVERLVNIYRYSNFSKLVIW